MTLTITPAVLRGSITPPPSKSQAHRLLIAAALAGGISRVENVVMSQDIQATLSCLEGMGTWFEPVLPAAFRVHGLGNSIPQAPLPVGALHCFDCGESGSTLRFLIPVALAAVGGGVFYGRGRLMQRPQKPYFDLFDEKGIFWERKDGALTVRGELAPGLYRLPGNVSSQFVTGLLYTLPLLDGDSEIQLTTPLESKGYVDMTILALEAFGVTVRKTGAGYFVPGDQRYTSAGVSVERDYSQAAFYYAAKGLGNPVEILGLNPRSVQGDRCIADYYQRLCQPGDAELDVSQCPDLVPALAVHAALRAGQTTAIVNAGRLRMKESDRLRAVRSELNKLGAKVEEHPGHLIIRGVERLRGGRADAHNDHRVAMMLAIAATRADGPVTLAGAESVQKSYPSFWDDYAALGGQLTFF